MVIKRRKTNVVRIGRVCIGGENPIAIQSMLKVPAKDIKPAAAQIKRLGLAGCAIVRLAVKDEEDARAIARLKRVSDMPLVADIHFDWRLAILSIKAGADKIRLNPGNIYRREQIREIVRVAKGYSIPIRVGLNSGSIPKRLQAKAKLPTSVKLVKAALDYIGLIEEMGFKDIVVSLKCSGILDTIESYQRMSALRGYPLHLGLTATGFKDQGKIKSAVGLGILLFSGIGDTMRISLTARPEEEVRAAQDILASLGLGYFGPQIISCPTCGRTEVDVEKVVNGLQKRLQAIKPAHTAKPFKLAVMGCVVNGPGEAADADLAIVFGRRHGLLYKDSKPVRKVAYGRALDALVKEYKRQIADRAGN